MNTTLPFDKFMIIRTIILVLAWLNQFLVLKGHGPIPFDDAQIEVGVSTFVTFVMSMWTWWKNNAITRNARKAELLAEQKGLK